MRLNHRYVLRIVTDGALGMFVVSAIGVGLWVTDEFLGWNVLPDWVDRYAQLIVVAFGMAAGLLMGASVLCSVALLAESSAERAGIQDYKAPPRIWRVVAASFGFLALAVFGFYQVDLYRKGVALDEFRKVEKARYGQIVKEFQTLLPPAIKVFPAHLAELMAEGRLSEDNQELITFLSAIQSSTARHPEVVLLTRAAPPYQYCRFILKERRNGEAGGAAGRFYIEKQFYTGFPTTEELRVVADVFGGRETPLDSALEGEVFNNVRPSAWGPIHWQSERAGVLVFRGEFANRFGFFHTGKGELGDDVPKGIANPKPN